MSDTLMSGTPAPAAEPAAPAAEPTPATAPPDGQIPLMSNDGVFDPNWHTRLGDTPIDDRLKGVSDLPTLIKGWTDGQSMIAKQSGELGTLRQQLADAGQQGAPDVYTFAQKPEGMPDADWNQANADANVEFMRELNISDEQATALDARFNEVIAERETAQAQAAEQALQIQVDELRTEWGKDFDANLEKAITVVEKMGGDVSDPAVGNNPGLARFLAKIADSVSESVLRGAGAGNTIGITPNSSGRAEAKAIVQDASHPQYKAFHDPGHPQHKDAQDKVAALNAQHVKLMGGGR